MASQARAQLLCKGVVSLLMFVNLSVRFGDISPRSNANDDRQRSVAVDSMVDCTVSARRSC
jgi:hypothetical protein